jgi:hypothetical protein
MASDEIEAGCLPSSTADFPVDSVIFIVRRGRN